MCHNYIYIYCLLFNILIGLSFQSKGQTINSLNIFPQNPSEQDSIYITVNSTFTNSSCDSSSEYFSMNNNTIYASTTHCIGMASAMCDATDTFLIGGLIAGSYTFIVNVNQGFLPSCTPGIVPGPTDTLKFNVSKATRVFYTKEQTDFLLYPNISNGAFLLKLYNLFDDTEFIVYSTNGEQVYKTKLFNEETKIHLKLAPGLYYCLTRSKQYDSQIKKLFITAN